MKRTLLVTIDFPPQVGGVANYWGNLAQHMGADNFVVLAPEEDNSLEFDMKQNYLIYRKNLFYKHKWIWPKWLLLLFQTYKICKQEKIEKVIVTHILPCGTVAYIIKKLLGIPYLVSMHGLDIAYASFSLRKKRLCKKILNCAEILIVNSNYTKELICKKLNYCPTTKVRVIYPCPNITATGQNVDQEKIQQVEARRGLTEKKTILTVGRLVKRKAHDQVIKALPKVIEQVSNAYYAIVGSGAELKNLQELVSSLGLEERVHFHVDMQNYELPLFYGLCDIFVMPARILSDGDVEGFGIVYLEANSFGMPVIAGNCGGAPEAVLHEQTGLVVDPENEDQIADAIIELLQNPKKEKELGQKGKQRVEEEFVWQKQAEKLRAVLE